MRQQENTEQCLQEGGRFPQQLLFPGLVLSGRVRRGFRCPCTSVGYFSVAVLMASQDVEVAVGCGVVCWSAFQHHHPV